MFEPQLGKNIEIYIDDMVVKNVRQSPNTLMTSRVSSRSWGNTSCDLMLLSAHLMLN